MKYPKIKNCASIKFDFSFQFLHNHCNILEYRSIFLDRATPEEFTVFVSNPYPLTDVGGYGMPLEYKRRVSVATLEEIFAATSGRLNFGCFEECQSKMWYFYTTFIDFDRASHRLGAIVNETCENVCGYEYIRTGKINQNPQLKLQDILIEVTAAAKRFDHRLKAREGKMMVAKIPIGSEAAVYAGEEYESQMTGEVEFTPVWSELSPLPEYSWNIKIGDRVSKEISDMNATILMQDILDVTTAFNIKMIAKRYCKVYEK